MIASLARLLPRKASHSAMATRSIRDFFTSNKPAVAAVNKDKTPVKSKNLKNTAATPVKTPAKAQSPEKFEGTPVKGRLSLKRSIIESDSEEEDGDTASDSDSAPTPVKQLKSCDISDYNPSLAKYNATNDAAWKQGEPVPYLALAKTLAYVETESANLKKVDILSNYLLSVLTLSPKDATPSTFLCLNKLAPDYEGLELGVGESLILKALAEATGRKLAIIKSDVEKEGDIGVVAETSRAKQKTMFAPPKLTVAQVFDKLKEVAKMTGHSSASKKTDVIKGLIVRSKECEARFLVRSLNGKLRIGLGEKMLLNALAKACILYENPKLTRSSDSFEEKSKEAIALLKEAYSEQPDFSSIISVILKHGIYSLPKYCKIKPGTPIKPMLAHPSTGIQDVLKRFDKHKFICEYKYDGERAQIHLKEDGSISIFSRNLEDNTTKYPDIISHIGKTYQSEDVKSFILDAEVVAWDKEGKKIQPFQVLSTRKRKDVKEEDIKVTVCLFAFDLLFLNGDPLNKKSLRERREALHKAFSEVEGFFFYAQGCEVSSDHEIQELIDKSVHDRCEGLMVKCLDEDATYEIAKRSHNWIKLKKDYLEGVGDSLDLVVIGAWFGKGKRVNSYGSFLLACYNQEDEDYQTICKLGTGFTDEDLEKLTTLLKEQVIDKPKPYFAWDGAPDSKPDVWFEASVVFEVKCADLTISPKYRAAIGSVDDEKGISLRFPRFVRLRDDKKAEEASSSEQVAEMYVNQDSLKGDASKADDDDDEV